jgi:tetratricopeptide (TPR) repeat protein
MKPASKSASILLLMLALISASQTFGQAAKKPAKAPTAPAKAEPPQDPLALLLKQADEAINKNNYAAAVTPLQSYLAQRPDDAAAHFQLGYAYTGLERADEAKAEYQKAIELNPKLTVAHINLGLLLLDRDPAAAAQSFRQAAELLPDRARPRYLLGQALERSKNLPAAIAAYEEAGRLDPKDFEVRFTLGRIMLQSDRFIEAEARFREAVAIKPDAARAQLGLAEALMMQKRYAPSAAAFAVYLAAMPGDKESRRENASVLLELDKYDEALAELDQADTGAAPSLASIELRADILVRQKMWPEAEGVLQNAIRQFANNAALHARLGRVLLAKHDLAPAERELRIALQIDSSGIEAQRDLVAVYYLGKNFPAALDALDRLEQREAPSTGSWFVRATCYDKLGKKREAIAAYQKFLELDKSPERDDQHWQARQRILALTHELQRKR